MNFINFVLGTANLGLNYGIANQEQFDRDHSIKVINHALRRGINTFDTAAEYGDAEELIGKTIIPGASNRIVTKIPSRNSYTYEYVSKCLDSSLKKLRMTKIHGLMFHDPEIQKKTEIREISKRLLASGKVEHLGFSTYSLNDLLEAKRLNPNWTIFQIPENILDRRLKNSIELAEMARANNIFHVRSIFLQGLLLLEPTNLPRKFSKYREAFSELHSTADRLGVRPIDLCVSYASSIPWCSGVVIAAASTVQLDEILNFKFLKTDFNQLETLPQNLLDPRLWSELK
jgi:aryl-alcohol dehydrogenase-like predicted oxidoreductase